MFKRFLLSFSALWLGICSVVMAADWPMWRYDASRSAASPEDLPETLQLQWSRMYSERKPVWDDPLNWDLMRYDSVFEPIVLGDTLFLGFNDADKVVALDVATGAEKWVRYVNGPVRLPLVGAKGRVYFGSDDGVFYCLDAETGVDVWTFDATPYARSVVGNHRLISTWPLRGGPVLADGVVYFAAGIWPFMGTFVYALDAETGAVRWLNDGNGPQWMIQPHHAPSFAGVAPQGVLVVAGEHLLVAGGRSIPACFDRRTGEFLHYRHGDNNKTGGSFVCAAEDVYFVHHRDRQVGMYTVADSKELNRAVSEYPVLGEDTWYFSGSQVIAVDAAQLRDKPIAVDRATRWTCPEEARGDLIAAGKRLYAASGNRIAAIEHADAAGTTKVVWTTTVPGEVKRLVAAAGRLFVVTQAGQLFAFGAETGAEHHAIQSVQPIAVSEAGRELVSEYVAELPLQKGYVLVYGLGDGTVVDALVMGTDYHIVVVEPDAEKVAVARRRYDAAGVLGERVACFHGDGAALAPPPYLAVLTVVQDFKALGIDFTPEAQVEALFSSVRPYGGRLVLTVADREAQKAFRTAARKAEHYGLVVGMEGGQVWLTREGALEGASSWTHQLGSIANTGHSTDTNIKLPLGMLWFGGSSNLDVLVRHGHGPPEQVMGGRLFIEGMDCMSARDVYTGQVLWKTRLLDLETYGVYYDHTYKDAPLTTRYNQGHLPGANVRGTNFVVTSDKVYVAQQSRAEVLDAVTGKLVDSIQMPPVDRKAKRKKYPDWGYIGVYKDTLLGGAGFVLFSDLVGAKKQEYSPFTDFDKSASKALIAFDRHRGRTNWRLDARYGWLHNGITAGSDTVFALDRYPLEIEQKARRRGIKRPKDYRLMAVNVEDGTVRWETEEDVFGSFLCYSEKHDILLQSARPSRDAMSGEKGSKFIAYRGKTGEVLWSQRCAYKTFPLLHDEMIVTESGLFDLKTGESLLHMDPLTGVERPWVWERGYGCNYPISSTYLLTFRSGCAGYCNILDGAGTGHLGGFKSGCTSNLLVADGVLNAPDYTRTCSCSYQNQTSLAFVHDPQVEYWTYHNMSWDATPLKQLGVNFGAPGDRRDASDTLWLEYPFEGGPTPQLTIEIAPEQPQWFRHHSSRMQGDGLSWVAASGVEGLSKLNLVLRPKASDEATYKVTLHFAEWTATEVGARIFDVALQGETVLTDYDPLQHAGAVKTPVTASFSGVKVQESLEIELREKVGKTLLCGVEVVAE